MSRTLRLAAGALVALALLIPPMPARAAARSPAAARFAGLGDWVHGFWFEVWAWTSAITDLGATGVWTKDGPDPDPNGSPALQEVGAGREGICTQDGPDDPSVGG